MSLRFAAWLVIFPAFSFGCFGLEIVHLANGFSLQAKSHKQVEDKLVLTTQAGTVEVPLSDVSQVESVPEIPEPPVMKATTAGQLATAPGDAAELVRQAAASEGTAPEFIRFVESVARVESGLQKTAVSPKGALGLMQLMPGTAKTLGVSPTDPLQNAQGGAKYLRELLQLYRSDSVLALAAYNAGPGAVQKYGGIPPYAETWQYVRKVLREYAKESQLKSNSSSATK